jgi:hypothetical protein
MYNRDEDILRGHPWPEIFNLRAAIADKILRLPLRIRRSSRNAVIRPPNAASLAVRQRRANKVGEAPGIVRLHPMEHLSSAPAAVSQQLFHLNLAAIVRFSAVTATRHAKAAAAAHVRDAIKVCRRGCPENASAFVLPLTQDKAS